MYSCSLIYAVYKTVYIITLGQAVVEIYSDFNVTWHTVILFLSSPG